MLGDALIWLGYIAAFIWLARKGQGHDAMATGRVGFVIQALAYVATYISAVALVGFGGLSYLYGMQMLLVAAGNVWLGTWFVYRYLAWPTRICQRNLQARTPTQLLAKGHKSPMLGKALSLIFAIFLGVYASAVIKGAALMLAQILPIPVWALVWIAAVVVGVVVFIGGLRGVLYTEAMQGVVMLVGIVLLIWAVLDRVGGPLEGNAQLAQLAPTTRANEGFLALSVGEQGWFVISLVMVTSVAVWSQPQRMQRHFALNSPRQINRITPLAMLVLTVLVGGTYFVAALSRIILPEIASADEVVPHLVKMLLPNAGLQVFVLAIVSASLSTATALYHIAVSAIAEDLPGKPATRFSWFLGIVFCVVVSGGSAQIKGQLIALLCTTSWSIVGATVLISYVALVRFGKRSALAACMSCGFGFTSCLLWYLLANKAISPTPILGMQAALVPPFFVGLAFSLVGWFAGWALDHEGRKASTFWPAPNAGS